MEAKEKEEEAGHGRRVADGTSSRRTTSQPWSTARRKTCPRRDEEEEMENQVKGVVVVKEVHTTFSYKGA